TRSVALVLIAIGAGAVTHLIFGTPSGGPTPDEVRDYLVSSGIDAQDMEEDVVAPGIHRMRGHLANGSSISVNVFAYDALDSQLWGGVTAHFKNRETKSRLVRARLDQAEHGMLMAALAREHDVPAVHVLRLVETDRSDVLLVSDGYGETLADRDMTADLARKMWALVVGLHRAGLVHSEISLQAISVDRDGDIAFNDLRSAYISDSTTGHILDKVNVLALTAMGLSVDEAVSIAQDFLSPDELRELIPYLQKAAISNSSSAAKNVNAKDLRLRVVEATGGEDVQLARIRLVDLRSIITMGIIAIITVSLYGLITGVDFVEILRSIRDADSQIILVAFLLAPVVQVFLALSTLGAANRPVKYFPALMLQYSIQFIAVTMPATAARMAMNIRFFQGFGFPPVQAVSIGVIDGFSGFIVQVLFLLTIWILGLSGFTVSLGTIITENTGRDFSGDHRSRAGVDPACHPHRPGRSADPHLCALNTPQSSRDDPGLIQQRPRIHRCCAQAPQDPHAPGRQRRSAGHASHRPGHLPEGLRIRREPVATHPDQHPGQPVRRPDAHPRRRRRRRSRLHAVPASHRRPRRRRVNDGDHVPPRHLLPTADLRRLRDSLPAQARVRVEGGTNQRDVAPSRLDPQGLNRPDPWICTIAPEYG
ncbi:MAG: hypothetical protein VW937_08755, partial [Actinomycetota bacterium]